MVGEKDVFGSDDKEYGYPGGNQVVQRSNALRSSQCSQSDTVEARDLAVQGDLVRVPGTGGGTQHTLGLAEIGGSSLDGIHAGPQGGGQLNADQRIGQDQAGDAFRILASEEDTAPAAHGLSDQYRLAQVQCAPEVVQVVDEAVPTEPFRIARFPETARVYRDQPETVRQPGNLGKPTGMISTHPVKQHQRWPAAMDLVVQLALA